MPTELNAAEFSYAEPLFTGFPYDAAWVEYAWNDPECRIWIDAPTAPTAALLCPQTRNMVSFLAGEPDNALALLLSVADLEITPPQLCFVSLPTESFAEAYRASGSTRFRIHERVSYTFNANDTNHIQNWRQRLPGELRIERMDATLAERISNSAFIGGNWSAYWPDTAQFAAEGLGFCLLNDQEILSLAWTGEPIGTVIEIGIETADEHRGCGYAQLTCAAMIEHCLTHDIQPVWSTHANHAASRALAEKLGFHQPVIHYWLR